MFNYLIFLMLVLLIAGVHGPVPDLQGMALGCILFVMLLALIIIQNRIFIRKLLCNNESVLFTVNCQIIAYLCVLYLLLGIPRLHYFPNLFSSSLALFIYFTAIFCFYYSSHESETKSPKEFASRQIRLLIPFSIPVILFSLLIDLFALTGIAIDELPVGLILFSGLVFALTLIILLPPLLIRCWQCLPLEEGALHNQLEQLCTKAHFRHGGMKIWTVLNHAPTAAIIGVIPSLRYIVFTKRLLETQSSSAIEAILAHEIGHNFHRHLFFFPYILMGMAVLGELLASFFGTGISLSIATLEKLYPSQPWPTLESFIYLFFAAVLIIIYVRFVFGYFSRLFERQADLYGLKLGLPASAMIEALDGVAIASGNTHDMPSWHHYSISQRIQFLQAVTVKPGLVEKHNLRVHRSLWAYTLLLIVSFLFLTAPLFPFTQPWKFFNEWGRAIEKKITLSLRHSI